MRQPVMGAVKQGRNISPHGSGAALGARATQAKTDEGGTMAAQALEQAIDQPMEMHGVAVKIVRASCHCGGSYAWMHQRPSGAWEMKGCVCHNPAVGP
jgi:hypothetical protein